MILRDPSDDQGSLTSLVSDHSPAPRSVLLVENDKLVQLRLEALLAPAGYSITTVGTLREARAAVGAVLFPIIIIDRILPDGDGADFCAEMNAALHRRRAFLLMFSARDSAHEMGVGLRSGANVYLSKRTSDAELLAYIDAASAVAQFATSRQRSAG